MDLLGIQIDGSAARNNHASHKTTPDLKQSQNRAIIGYRDILAVSVMHLCFAALFSPHIGRCVLRSLRVKFAASPRWIAMDRFALLQRKYVIIGVRRAEIRKVVKGRRSRLIYVKTSVRLQSTVRRGHVLVTKEKWGGRAIEHLGIFVVRTPPIFPVRGNPTFQEPSPPKPQQTPTPTRTKHSRVSTCRIFVSSCP